MWLLSPRHVRQRSATGINFFWEFQLLQPEPENIKINQNLVEIKTNSIKYVSSLSMDDLCVKLFQQLIWWLYYIIFERILFKQKNYQSRNSQCLLGEWFEVASDENLCFKYYYKITLHSNLPQAPIWFLILFLFTHIFINLQSCDHITSFFLFTKYLGILLNVPSRTGPSVNHLKPTSSHQVIGNKIGYHKVLWLSDDSCEKLSSRMMIKMM